MVLDEAGCLIILPELKLGYYLIVLFKSKFISYNLITLILQILDVISYQNDKNKPAIRTITMV